MQMWAIKLCLCTPLLAALASAKHNVRGSQRSFKLAVDNASAVVSAAPAPSLAPATPPTYSVDKPHTFEANRIAISGKLWKTFLFQKKFEQIPVVFVLTTTSGDNPAVIRIKDVTLESFNATIVEPEKEDPPHDTSQTVAYFAVAPGVSQFPDGRMVEAGLVSLESQVASPPCAPQSFQTGWSQLQFQHMFPGRPVFLTQLQTMVNMEHAVPVDVAEPFVTVAVEGVTGTGARVSLERGGMGGFGDITQPESLGFVAIEPGHGEFTGIFGNHVKYSAVISGEAIKGWGTAGKVDFNTDLGTPDPLILGSLDTRNSAEGGWLRVEAATSTDATFVIDEDRACDTGRVHEKQESASIIAMSGGFTA